MLYNRIIKGLVFSLVTAVSVATYSFQAQAYEAGTISIKPLNFNLNNFSLGTRPKDSSFSIPTFAPTPDFSGVRQITKSSKLNGWRSPLQFGFSEGDRNGNSYAFEAGYVVIKDWEVFGRAGFCHERPKGQFIQGSEHSFRMKPRNDWALSLGLRRYFETSNAFKPFLSVSMGFVSQGATKLKYWAHNIFAGNVVKDDIFQGQKNLVNRQALFSFEAALGADYVFNKNWAISGSVAARYNQRGSSKTVLLPYVPGLAPFPVPARPLTYKDNKQHWYMPVTLSIKCMF